MTLVEKMARSDAAFDGRDFGALGAADKKRYLARSLAGLETLREPTDEMAQAGLDELLTHLGPSAAIIRDPVYCWRAMVNAAIIQQNQ